MGGCVSGLSVVLPLLAEEAARGDVYDRGVPYAWSASFNLTGPPVRGKASTAPVSELRLKSRPGWPLRLAALNSFTPSDVGARTLVPAVT